MVLRLGRAVGAQSCEGLRVPGGSRLSLSSLDSPSLQLKNFRRASSRAVFGAYARFEELSTFFGIDNGTDLATHWYVFWFIWVNVCRV